jgi:hypothetical protein
MNDIEGSTWLSAAAVLIILFLFVTYGIYEDVYHDRVCYDSVTVVGILRVDYRDATLLLSDGTQVILSQSYTQPGDAYCKDWRKERTAEPLPWYTFWLGK